MTLNLNSHKVFHCNGKEYLFIAETGALFELDEKTSFLIKCNGLDYDEVRDKMLAAFSIADTEIVSLIGDLDAVKLLGCCHNPPELEYSLDYLKGIELMVCQHCNLSCTYCYATEGEYKHPGRMSEDVGKKAIDFLFAHSKEDSISVSFFGGEPLMNIQLIEKLVQYANQLAFLFKKKVMYSVTTNGTLIDDRIAGFLNKNNFYVSLSIDGTKLGHDSCRIDKVGHGSYVDATKNTGLLHADSVSLRATSTPKNCNYTEIANALFDLKETVFYIGEAMNCFTTDEDLKRVEESYSLLIEDFLIDLSCGRIKKCKSNFLIYHNLKKIAFFEERSCSCSAFLCTVAIDIEGFIYPCHRFVGSTYRLGNVCFDGIDLLTAKTLFEKDFLRKNRDGCSFCWAQNLCIGGCPYLNREATGKCNTPDINKCRLNKYLFEKLVILFISLTVEQKNFLGLL